MYLSADEWIKSGIYILPCIKKDYLEAFVGKWMPPEHTILSEINETHKLSYRVVPLI